MSLLGTLAANAVPKPRALSWTLGASSQIVVDGNSISANHSSVTLASLLIDRLDRLGVNLYGTVIDSVAANGDTWQSMTARASATMNLWDPTKNYHLLITSENTNSIRNGGTLASVSADIDNYIAAVTDINKPWTILGWGAVPFGHADSITYPSEAQWPMLRSQLNSYLRTKVDAWADITQHAQYNHDGTRPVKFSKYRVGWQDAPGGGNWPTWGWLHPTTGDYPTNSNYSDGYGKKVIAAIIVDTILSGSVILPT